MKSLTIVQQDHPGLMAEVTTLLERNGIGVCDFVAQAVGNTAIINLTVAPYEETFRLLSDAGYQVVASEHLLVRLGRQAGALAELSRRLANAQIDVRGMHIVNTDENTGIVALETNDAEDARALLKDILL